MHEYSDQFSSEIRYGIFVLEEDGEPSLYEEAENSSAMLAAVKEVQRKLPGFPFRVFDRELGRVIITDAR